MFNTVGSLHIGSDCTNQASCTVDNVVFVASVVTVALVPVGGTITAVATNTTLVLTQS